MKRRGGNKQNPWRPAKWDEHAGEPRGHARQQSKHEREQSEHARQQSERVHPQKEDARQRDEQARRQDERALERGEYAREPVGERVTRESPGERVARAFAVGKERDRKTCTKARTQTTKTHAHTDDARAKGRGPFESEGRGRLESEDGAHVFGVQPVLEALRAGARPVERVTVAEGAHESRLQEILELARVGGVPVRRAPRAELQRLAAGANHQGVVATIAAARYTPADELLDALAARVGTSEPPLAVVLDGVEDPRNLGAIIRTAECAGAHGVFVPERRASGLTETVAKSAAGALEYVPVARAVNIARLVEELKGRGVWTVGAASEAAIHYTEWDWTQPCALLLGGEGEGLRRLVRERCDALVHIPLLGRIESLNVSVAAGVVLYEAVRQRTARRAETYNESLDAE